MPRVASRHRSEKEKHKPSSAWPEDCFVQWGSRGIVLAGDKTYSTAFFEAFPESGSFIRGEGETVADAEASALGKYEKQNNCHHVFQRRQYRNGAGICAKCGGFFSDAFSPIVTLGCWKQPLSVFELETAFAGEVTHHPDPTLEEIYRRTWLRLKAAGINMPDRPAEPQPVSLFESERSQYELTCREIIFRFIDAKGGIDESWISAPNGVFDRLSFEEICGEYKAWQDSQAHDADFECP